MLLNLILGGNLRALLIGTLLGIPAVIICLSFHEAAHGLAAFLMGDRTAIGQLVSILLDNAVKYSAERGVVRLHVCRSGKRAEIEVYNTLPSAEKLDCKRLFERFYRPDASRNAATGGSGVGLSIAKATAEAHGGTIKARQNGREITFTVRL